jgi:hypothetical protein
MGWKEGEALGTGKFKGCAHAMHETCKYTAYSCASGIRPYDMSCPLILCASHRLAEPVEYVPKFGRGGLGAGPMKDVVCQSQEFWSTEFSIAFFMDLIVEKSHGFWDE